MTSALISTLPSISIRRPSHVLTSSRTALYLLLFVGMWPLHAQEPGPGRIEVAVTLATQRSLSASTNRNFWMVGGSAEMGYTLGRGVGLVADLTGAHTGSIGSSGVPLDITTLTFGPRYRWSPRRRWSVYGQALIGEATGYNSQFPTSTHLTPTARSFALQLGGGLDYRLSRRFALRGLDVGYLRTTLPNNAGNVQNSLRLGAGLVYRFGR
jgi:outer membrane immunogenic protein